MSRIPRLVSSRTFISQFQDTVRAKVPFLNFCLTLSVEFVRLISLPHSVSEPLDLNDFIFNPTHCFFDIFS